MSDLILFKDLPATFPEEDRYQNPSIVSSVVFHVLLISVLVLLPLLFPRAIEEWQLKTLLVSPLPPPPAATPAPIELTGAAPAMPKVEKLATPEAGALISPVVIPKDIVNVVDEPIEPVGVFGGVPGGVPGGMASGVLGGLLAAGARAEVALPPPPSPPTPAAPPAPAVPKAPVRVGGDVREPQILNLIPPVFPAFAMKARVSGTVVLEATLTEQGTVENIRVISGHPLLIEAAIDCVKQWVYAPTYLNGQPVAVILTAKVVFHPRVTQ